MTSLLITIAVLCLLAAVHSFATYPLSLALLARFRPAPALRDEGAGGGNIAVCMCAYNEEAVIEAKILNLLELAKTEPGMEILIYVDASSDKTAEIASRYRSKVKLFVAKSRRGKTFGMNLLVSRTRAAILVFTDANVMIDAQAFKALRRSLADRSVGCVCGTISVTNSDASVTARTGSAYARLDHFTRRLESRTGSVMGAHGGLFAIRRHLHRAPPEHIIDDMFVSLRVLSAGYRVIQADDFKAYERAAESAGDEFRRKVRIACQAVNVNRLLAPNLNKLSLLDSYKYLSHKKLRWYAIYSLAASILAVMLALINEGYTVAALASLCGGSMLLWFGHLMKLPVLAQIADLLTALYGTGLGVWKSVRGERFQTWTPAATVRRLG